jgi:hypothetical protein
MLIRDKMFHSSMAFGLEKGMRRCAGVKKLSTSVGHKNELRRVWAITVYSLHLSGAYAPMLATLNEWQITALLASVGTN